MALSLGDVFLNFTAGAVERNNQIRDENVALALEDFKANKDLYQKIALDRYTRDANKYDTEVEKLDSLKSVYSNIQNNNYDRKTAATMILNKTVDNFASLPENTQKRMIENTANSFKTKYKTIQEGPAGSESRQVEDGFEIVPEQIKLNAPNMKDYLQDPSFWTNLQDEIKTGTSGPLTEQVLKLLGKKDLSTGAKEKLDNLEQRDGTAIRSEANVPSYSSNNMTSINLAMAGEIYAYGDGSAADLPQILQGAWEKYVVNDPDEGQRKEIGEIFNTLKLSDIKDAIIQYQDGKAVVRPGGNVLFGSAQNLYKGIAEDILNSIMLPNGVNAGQTNFFTNQKVREVYEREFYKRLVKVNDNEMKGYYLIPRDVMGYGINLSDYKKQDGSSVTKEDIIALIKSNNLQGSLGENNTIIHNQVKAYLATLKNDKVKNTGSTGTGSTGTGGTDNKQMVDSFDKTVEFVKNVSKTDAFKNSGESISSVVENLNKDYGFNYDAKAIEVLAPLEMNIPSKTIKGGKKDNPQFVSWLQSEQGNLWKTAIDYINSIEPEKFTTGSLKQQQQNKVPVNPEWNEWNKNFNRYIELYSKTQ